MCFSYSFLRISPTMPTSFLQCPRRLAAFLSLVQTLFIIIVRYTCSGINMQCLLGFYILDRYLYRYFVFVSIPTFFSLRFIKEIGNGLIIKVVFCSLHHVHWPWTAMLFPLIIGDDSFSLYFVLFIKKKNSILGFEFKNLSTYFLSFRTCWLSFMMHIDFLFSYYILFKPF